MFPVLNVTIIVKANLSSLNIKYENRYSLSASQDYNCIRLRTKPQMGFTMKGYLAGQLLCSLVSQDLQTLQMEGIPSQLQHSQGLTARWRMDPGNFSAYALVFSTPQKSGFDSLNVVCTKERKSIKCHWQKFKPFDILATHLTLLLIGTSIRLKTRINQPETEMNESLHLNKLDIKIQDMVCSPNSIYLGWSNWMPMFWYFSSGNEKCFPHMYILSGGQLLL